MSNCHLVAGRSLIDLVALKAGASRPRTMCGYGLYLAKSLGATATVRSTRCADRCNGRPRSYRRGAWR